MKPNARPVQPPDAVERRFLELSAGSRKAFEHVQALIPGGSPGGLGIAPRYPISVARGDGAFVWDADGRRLLDLLAGDWLLPFGHGNAAVLAAVSDQMARGLAFGTPEHRLAQAVADHLRRKMPSMERMRFTTSGTEATMSALRLARAFTGKTKIAKMSGGYHGSHDVSLIRNGKGSSPDFIPPGLIRGIADEVLILPFNDVERSVALLEGAADVLAAVIVEPMLGGVGMIPANSDYLSCLRKVTTRHGILLIFDEVLTFMVGPGGAQGRYDVFPDLTALGKALGGGLPLGAFGGKTAIMDLLDPYLHDLFPPVRHGSTMGGSALPLASSLATLEQLTPEVYAHLGKLGDRVRAGVRQIATELRVPLQATGLGHFFGLHWTRHPVVSFEAAMTSDKDAIRHVWMSLFNEGYLLYPNFTSSLSVPMTEALVDGFIEALRRSCASYLRLTSA